MAKREMIISGYTGPNAEKDVQPFLQHLVGQFVDELNEADKLLYEYTTVAMLGDLWIAVWDDEKFELEALNSTGGGDRGPYVSIGCQPTDVKELLPALYILTESNA